MSRQPDDDSDDSRIHRMLSRRDLIKRSLAVGSLPYVAPMILGSVKTASAQVISGFGCSNPVTDCDDDSGDFECGGGIDECLCFPTVEGPNACILAECTDVSCGNSDDCPPGSVCVDLGPIDNCSDECNITPLCVSLCGLVTLTGSESRTSVSQPFASRR